MSSKTCTIFGFTNWLWWGLSHNTELFEEDKMKEESIKSTINTAFILQNYCSCVAKQLCSHTHEIYLDLVLVWKNCLKKRNYPTYLYKYLLVKPYAKNIWRGIWTPSNPEEMHSLSSLYPGGKIVLKESGRLGTFGNT